MPIKGIKALRHDIAKVNEKQYIDDVPVHCGLDPETPEHCTITLNKLIFELWLDDVSLYPTNHTACIFITNEYLTVVIMENPAEMELKGDLTRMIRTVISRYIHTPRQSKQDKQDLEMTDIDDSQQSDDDEDNMTMNGEWDWDWDDQRKRLLQANCDAVVDSQNTLLRSAGFRSTAVVDWMWVKSSISELTRNGVLDIMELDSWRLDRESTLWIVLELEKERLAFKAHIRQAPDTIDLNDITTGKIPKYGVLAVLESYVQINVLHVLPNTLLSVGQMVIERLPKLKKYCSMCGTKEVDIPSLKPFCCAKDLCQFQFQYLDPNNELESMLIEEPAVVDLLIQLAYCAAFDNELSPYPKFLSGETSNDIKDESDICNLLNSLPPVDKLAKLVQVPYGLQAAFSKGNNDRALRLLRWVVLSNRAHLRHLRKPEEMIAGLNKHWTQFKMLTSRPEKEEIFQRRKAEKNGKTIFGFHGSPLFNWHSILRTELNTKKILHGRACGHGIYHGYDTETSLQYTLRNPCLGGKSVAPKTGLPAFWKNASTNITRVISVNEIVYDESHFVTTSPCLVVAEPNNIQTRYLISYLSTKEDMNPFSSPIIPNIPANNKRKFTQVQKDVEYHTVTDRFRLWDCKSTGSLVQIPKDAFALPAKRNTNHRKKLNFDQCELPSYASSAATEYLQKELKKLLVEKPDKEDLVFQLDSSRLDNLYTWHVFLKNFPGDLPLAQDLQRLSLPHIELEIKFGPQTPFTPPFIRIVQPRFLSFSSGGGGHVTLGGSLCISMLCMDDWSPAYDISQVLVAVHAALCSTEPRPAQIADKGRYEEREALSAYVRVATTHGWRVPEGWETLFSRG